MQYAYLQLGQDAKAKALIDENAEIKKVIGPIAPSTPRVPRCPRATCLERQDWKGAAQLQAPRHGRFPPAEAITHFAAQAMGAARSGDPAAAQADIEKLKALREGLLKVNQAYWAEQSRCRCWAPRRGPCWRRATRTRR
jgi:hypothetical protein